MYANLKVTIQPGPDGTGKDTVYAWLIGAGPGPLVTLHLDANDGTGNYAEPAGEREVDLTTHSIEIGADF